MLTKQLRALEDDKLVIRKVYAEVPPRVEYTLSEIGESLRPVIDTLKAWGRAIETICPVDLRPKPSKRRIVQRSWRSCVPHWLLSLPPRIYI